MSDSYHSGTDRLSASGAKLILRTPLEYFTKYGPHAVQDKPKPAFRFGTAFHILVLEGEEEFKRRVTCVPNWKEIFTKPRSKAAMFERQEWEGRQEERDPDLFFTSEEYDQMLYMRDCVFEHKAASEILAEGKPETVFTADVAIEIADLRSTPEDLDDEDIPITIETIGIKAKIDWVTHDDAYLCDLKTCSDIDPRKLGADAWNYGYHLQQAFHRFVYAQSIGYPQGVVDEFRPDSTFPRWDWIFVSKNSYDKRNYPVRVIHPTEAEEEAGRELMAEAMRIYARCKRDNEWPGPSQESEPLLTPSWAKWR